MARISSDQLRQFITDGKLSRSKGGYGRQTAQPNPDVQANQASQSNPNYGGMVRQQQPMQATRARNKPKVIKVGSPEFEEYKDAYAAHKGVPRTKPNPSSDPTQVTAQAPAAPQQTVPQAPTRDQIQQRTEEIRKDTEEARQRAAQQTQEFMSQPREGLTPQQRQMYEEAYKRAVDGEIQSQRRLSTADMGSRGIYGGAAQIPQTEITKYALDSIRDFQRDLDVMDYDRAMENLVAKLSMQEGLVGNDILARQQAWDELYGNYSIDEQNRLSRQAYKDYYGRYPDEKEEDVMEKYKQYMESLGFKPKKKKNTNRVGSRV